MCFIAYDYGPLLPPAGRLQIPQEALRKKNVLITRGRFRPFTLLHNDMLMGAAQQFFCDPPAGSMFDSTDSVTTGSYDECVYRDDTMVLLELTTRDMMEVRVTPCLAPLKFSVPGQSRWASSALLDLAVRRLMDVELLLGLVDSKAGSLLSGAGGQGVGRGPSVDHREATHAALRLNNCCPAGATPGRSLCGHIAAVRLTQWSLQGGSPSYHWHTLCYPPASRPCLVHAAGRGFAGLDHSGWRHPGGSLPAAHRGPFYHGEPCGLQMVGWSQRWHWLNLRHSMAARASSFLYIVSRVSQLNPLQIKPCPSSSRFGNLLSSFRMPVPHVKRRPHRRACVCLQGYSVLLSNYRRYFSLAGYLSTFTRESIVIAMGIPSLAVSCRAACEGCMLSSVCIILHLHLWGSLRRLALPGMFPLIPASGLFPCVAGKAGSELCGSCSVTPSSVF